ncbi:hypothetical protein E4U13_007801 [Claviceps humidiphila]|uniref:Uncharacterized protein n=1 Tax=Claviceps humidiphila TaxID=1294629 RepID=A0A9P7Q4Q9_9HYPO|nr:hypothetical protein E4U13_007801 [Claviceps humidiphila]
MSSTVDQIHDQSPTASLPMGNLACREGKYRLPYRTSHQSAKHLAFTQSSDADVKSQAKVTGKPDCPLPTRPNLNPIPKKMQRYFG